MSSYNRDTKAYESYEMLTKLLNSDKKENIQTVYDTLRQLTESQYNSNILKSKADYAAKRDALSQNRAKSEKYLNYFMTEGGYANSGIAADARVKQEINYENNVSALNKEELRARDELLRIKNEELGKVERDRAQAQIDADEALAESVYKNEQLQLEKQQLAQDNYWKGKEYELATQGSGGSSSSSSSTGGASSGTNGNSAYNAVMYNDAMKELGKTRLSGDIQEMYNSLTGKNTDEAKALYGSYYEKLLSDVREKLVTTLKAEKSEGNINEICRMMMQLGRDPDIIFIDLYNSAATGDGNSKYTVEEVEEAYRRIMRIYY